jgi:hypothetical protein
MSVKLKPRWQQIRDKPDLVLVEDLLAAPTWAGIYEITTDPGIPGVPFNFGGVLTFSQGFVFRRPGGIDGYLQPGNVGTYYRA